jgi:hypothetical protein
VCKFFFLPGKGDEMKKWIAALVLLSSCAFSHSGKYGTVTVTLSVQDVDNIVRMMSARGKQYRTEDGKTVIIIKKGE